jgi:hypothetical protein
MVLAAVVRQARTLEPELAPLKQPVEMLPAQA